MICLFCGKQVPQNAQFCSYCGNKIIKTDDSNETPEGHNYFGVNNKGEKAVGKNKRITLTVIGIVLILIAIIFVCIHSQPAGKMIPESERCGINLRWSFDEETKTLTISGSGPMYGDYEPRNASLGKDHNRKRPWDANKMYERIEAIVIEEGCTRIGDYAFSGLEWVNQVMLPESITEIGFDAFSRCTRLTSIELPKNLIKLDNAFMGTGIRKLHLPETVSLIGSIGEFVPNLNEITVDEKNTNFTSIDGVLFSKDMTRLCVYPCEKEGRSYTVPDGVTEIANCAFREAQNLKKVILPESVKEFGRYSFDLCSNLSEINIPKAVTVLAEEVFSDCGMKTIVIPSNIVEIGSYAFFRCDPSTINIEEGVEIIGDYAFANCYAVKDIYIPRSIKSIENTAFEDCRENPVIHYAGTMGQWLSFAKKLKFGGTVECADGNYRYTD